MRAPELRKGSPRWRGLRLQHDSGELGPVRIACRGHDALGLCDRCAGLFRDVLTDAPRLLDDLDTAIARDVQFVEHGIVFGVEHADGIGGNPWVDAYQRLSRALALAGGWFDWTHPEQLARQLLRALDLLIDEPALPRIAAAVASASARAHAVLERPEDWAYLGSCPDCSVDLYGLREDISNDESIVKCRAPGCDYSRNMNEHKLAKLDEGDSRMLTEDELVGAITSVGEVVTRKQIRRFVKHEGVTRSRTDVPRLVNGKLFVESVWTYRLGDVRVLADGENPANLGTVTSREVARLFGVDDAAVRKWVERNELAPVRKGAKPLRFKLIEVERFKLARSAKSLAVG